MNSWAHRSERREVLPEKNLPELAGRTPRSERQRVTFRVMKFGRYVTVDDGGNHVTFHELNQRLRKDKKKAQSDSVSNREF